MNPRTHSTIVSQLVPIWQRIFGKSSIDMYDDFFALGGNAAIAKRLFAEAGKIGAKRFPPVMILIAPTVAAMAALLERPASVKLPPIIPLKKGDNMRPVFMAYGIGSSALDLHLLAQHLDTTRALYGFQLKGTEGCDEPHDRVEDIAQFHLEAMTRIQPHGPYFLIGYSFGGLVMLEIAQRLREKGEKIGLLAQLDSYPGKNRLRPAQFLPLASRLMKRRIFNLLSNTSSYYQEVPTPEAKRQKEKTELALARYRPRYYPGEVRFVKAADVSDFPDDPIAVWSGFVGKLSVETIPGNHFEMLTSHVEDLSQVLSRYLSETI